MSSKLVRQGECNSCGECCKKLRITGVLSNILRQHGTLEDAEAYYLYHGVKLVDVDKITDRALLEIDRRCDQLSEDNRCALHGQDKKPFICQKYPWFPDDIESCGFYFKKVEGGFFNF